MVLEANGTGGPVRRSPETSAMLKPLVMKSQWRAGLCLIAHKSVLGKARENGFMHARPKREETEEPG